jgi:predicted DNA-binding protein with PD1-like motif
MDFVKTKLGYQIRLDRGDELISSLTEFCKKKKISSASISGIGGTTEVVLGHYDLKNKKFNKKTFEKSLFEIISLIGNITLLDGKPFIHIHLSIGLPDFSTASGHLFSAQINPTCEINLIKLDSKVVKKYDDISGLNLQCFVKS